MNYSNLPAGFAMALAMNPRALNAYAAMTREQQNAVTEEARSAQTSERMHRLIDNLAKNQTL